MHTGEATRPTHDTRSFISPPSPDPRPLLLPATLMIDAMLASPSSSPFLVPSDAISVRPGKAFLFRLCFRPDVPEVGRTRREGHISQAAPVPSRAYVCVEGRPCATTPGSRAPPPPPCDLRKAVVYPRRWVGRRQGASSLFSFSRAACAPKGGKRM